MIPNDAATTKREPTTTRQAYKVEIDYTGQQVVRTYTCTITPKRVVVTGQGYRTYYEPRHWPARGAAWTVAEAWALFLAEQRGRLASARTSVEYLEAQIAKAEVRVGIGFD